MMSYFFGFAIKFVISYKYRCTLEIHFVLLHAWPWGHDAQFCCFNCWHSHRCCFIVVVKFVISLEMQIIYDSRSFFLAMCTHALMVMMAPIGVVMPNFAALTATATGVLLLLSSFLLLWQCESMTREIRFISLTVGLL